MLVGRLSGVLEAHGATVPVSRKTGVEYERNRISLDDLRDVPVLFTVTVTIARMFQHRLFFFGL